MPSSSPPLKVLVVGAGIAGTTLTFWLSKSPAVIEITILERAPTPRTAGQAVDIRGPAVKVMKEMGIEAEVLRRGTTEDGNRFVDEKGNIVAQFNKTGDSSKQSATSEYEILRADLARLLIDTTERRKGVKYVFGDSVANLEEKEDAVEVTFSSGSRPSETFDVVVAADGLSSRTRSLILPTDELENCYSFIGGYCSFFSIPSKPSDSKYASWLNFPGGRGVYIRPHQNPDTMGAYLMLCTPSHSTRDPAFDRALAQGQDEVKALIKERFRSLPWETDRLLQGMESADDFYCDELARMKLPRWTKGPCALLGDTAYAPTPISGMGTSIAMVGAFVLAGELSKHAKSREGEVAQALQSYESVLRPLVEKAQKLPWGAPQIANPQTWWGIAILRTLLKVVYWTGLDSLFDPGSSAKDTWQMPVYEWAA
ncbi:FAD/NAD(P)-binding domain-containing protein [Aulographum hederae CBS 113979]|uniref:FAD/NAD(P)-binding domain-containing protein n=1 Tax=Aulographum hederae CBS 113979 TaxID=1176131 RepID=A0A6G1GX18_9PEZI|nr:FAD/NAD(P)-binding domain-containing protein [Aulographum hederae CBS 113979]